MKTMSHAELTSMSLADVTQQVEEAVAAAGHDVGTYKDVIAQVAQLLLTWGPKFLAMIPVILALFGITPTPAPTPTPGPLPQA